MLKRANLTRIMIQKTKQIKKILGLRAELLFSKIFEVFLGPLSKSSCRVFEFKRIKQAVGVLVIASFLSMALLPASISAVQTNLDSNSVQILPVEEEIKTERTIRLPVENFRITQGYHVFHPGVDFAGATGSPVYTIAEGVVESVVNDKWAFGKHVIVDHSNGMKSLYAHLSKIEVKTGEKLDKDSVVGLLGSTGWSTGPHLHFQIWENGKLVNPKTFFEGYFGQKLASTQ